MELPTARREGDIGIAPLANISFNESRSTVKLNEYGAAGMAWLASPVGAYTELGTDHGGCLAADTGWGSAIARTIDDPRGRFTLIPPPSWTGLFRRLGPL